MGMGALAISNLIGGACSFDDVATRVRRRRRRVAEPPDAGGSRTFAAQGCERVIHIFLNGGLSHADTF
jgi:hypothetical protein